MGVGAVLRDHEGKSVVAIVRRYKGSWNPDIARAYATRFGVWLAVRFGVTKVILEGDSKMVMSSVSREADGFAPIFCFI